MKCQMLRWILTKPAASLPFTLAAVGVTIYFLIVTDGRTAEIASDIDRSGKLRMLGTKLSLGPFGLFGALSVAAVDVVNARHDAVQVELIKIVNALSSKYGGLMATVQLPRCVAASTLFSTEVSQRMKASLVKYGTGPTLDRTDAGLLIVMGNNMTEMCNEFVAVADLDVKTIIHELEHGEKWIYYTLIVTVCVLLLAAVTSVTGTWWVHSDAVTAISEDRDREAERATIAEHKEATVRGVLFEMEHRLKKWPTQLMAIGDSVHSKVEDLCDLLDELKYSEHALFGQLRDGLDDVLKETDMMVAAGRLAFSQGTSIRHDVEETTATGRQPVDEGGDVGDSGWFDLHAVLHQIALVYQSVTYRDEAGDITCVGSDWALTKIMENVLANATAHGGDDGKCEVVLGKDCIRITNRPGKDHGILLRQFPGDRPERPSVVSTFMRRYREGTEVVTKPVQSCQGGVDVEREALRNNWSVSLSFSIDTVSFVIGNMQIVRENTKNSPPMSSVSEEIALDVLSGPGDEEEKREVGEEEATPVAPVLRHVVSLEDNRNVRRLLAPTLSVLASGSEWKDRFRLPKEDSQNPEHTMDLRMEYQGKGSLTILGSDAAHTARDAIVPVIRELLATGSVLFVCDNIMNEFMTGAPDPEWPDLSDTDSKVVMGCKLVSFLDSEEGRSQIGTDLARNLRCVMYSANVEGVGFDHLTWEPKSTVGKALLAKAEAWMAEAEARVTGVT